ncbi:MAG: D-alanyl-D-alanine endopeptidase [Gammaproteobacteria bacterium]|nr:D-alanyl-D-alanine endopeptidase [Gammaproteobacteria bacterium]
MYRIGLIFSLMWVVTPSWAETAAEDVVPAPAPAQAVAQAVAAPSEISADVSTGEVSRDHWKGWNRVDLNPARLRLNSSTAMVVDQQSGELVFGKNADQTIPIASITKLITAMVTLDAKLPLDEPIEISKDDRDRLRGSRSRLRAGQVFSRGELLQLALLASENRAASALGRSFPGGKAAFIKEMNEKARQLGLRHTHFVDATGLNSDNVSTARELVKMVQAAYEYPFIRDASTAPYMHVATTGKKARRALRFGNTNRLVRNDDWHIGLSKTGYISDSGYCLVMQVEIGSRPLIVVLLDSWGKQSRIGDAKRLRKWLEKAIEEQAA